MLEIHVRISRDGDFKGGPQDTNPQICDVASHCHGIGDLFGPTSMAN